MAKNKTPYTAEDLIAAWNELSAAASEWSSKLEDDEAAELREKARTYTAIADALEGSC